MITDTQWLMRALVAELEQAGIADAVAAPNVTTYDAALDALREYPQRVIFCLPGAVNMEHDVQGGYPVKAVLTDDVLRVLTWSALGYAGRIICKPRQAAPLPIVWEDAPGRAVWSMTIDVTCLENEF